MKVIAIAAIFSLFAVSMSASLDGGIEKLETLPEDVSNWVVRRLAGVGGYNGLYQVVGIHNPRSQIVSGVKYIFTMDVKSVSKDKDGNYLYKTCDVEVVDAPWESDQRFYFSKTPECVDTKL